MIEANSISTNYNSIMNTSFNNSIIDQQKDTLNLFSNHFQNNMDG